MGQRGRYGRQNRRQKAAIAINNVCRVQLVESSFFFVGVEIIETVAVIIGLLLHLYAVF